MSGIMAIRTSEGPFDIFMESASIIFVELMHGPAAQDTPARGSGAPKTWNGGSPPLLEGTLLWARPTIKPAVMRVAECCSTKLNVPRVADWAPTRRIPPDAGQRCQRLRYACLNANSRTKTADRAGRRSAGPLNSQARNFTSGSP